MALVPLNLFVTHDGKSRRQHVTCRYKCGDACTKPVPNISTNEYFGDIAKAVSRRAMLRASGIAVLAVGPGTALAACSKGEQPTANQTSSTEPLAFDSHGNLWISTDGNALDSNDGLFAVALDGPNRGETKQFLTVPLGAETCGPVITDDLVTVCVQHPGEHDDNNIDNPLSRWPEGGNGTARPSVVAVWKSEGRIGV
jgi:secreted PhoX family phosphatase